MDIPVIRPNEGYTGVQPTAGGAYDQMVNNGRTNLWINNGSGAPIQWEVKNVGVSCSLGHFHGKPLVRGIVQDNEFFITPPFSMSAFNHPSTGKLEVRFVDANDNPLSDTSGILVVGRSES